MPLTRLGFATWDWSRPAASSPNVRCCIDEFGAWLGKWVRCVRPFGVLFFPGFVSNKFSLTSGKTNPPPKSRQTPPICNHCLSTVTATGVPATVASSPNSIVCLLLHLCNRRFFVLLDDLSDTDPHQARLGLALRRCRAPPAHLLPLTRTDAPPRHRATALRLHRTHRATAPPFTFAPAASGTTSPLYNPLHRENSFKYERRSLNR